MRVTGRPTAQAPACRTLCVCCWLALVPCFTGQGGEAQKAGPLSPSPQDEGKEQLSQMERGTSSEKRC